VGNKYNIGKATPVTGRQGPSSIKIWSITAMWTCSVWSPLLGYFHPEDRGICFFENLVNPYEIIRSYSSENHNINLQKNYLQQIKKPDFYREISL
jgi:hypothetical protein